MTTNNRPILHDAVAIRTCLIDGQWVGAISNRVTTVMNKANAEVITTVPDMDNRDAKLAISAANIALHGVWSSYDIKSRSKLLRDIASAMQKQKSTLAEIITLENGKPLHDAKAEIDFAADYFQWYAAMTLQLSGHIAPSMVANVSNFVVKVPVGVCALITPWNFPIMMIARKLAPTLGAGCTAVIKTSVECPLTALALCHLIQSIGIPPGVINVLTSSKENEADIGRELCQSDQVRKLSFTGSSRVGKLLSEQCGSTLKKLTMELGGNAPFIVFPDACLSQAVDAAVTAKFRNNGQSCICVNRFFIHEDIYNEFLTAFVERVKMLKVGNGFDADVDLGPMISQASVEKVERHIRKCVSMGAKVVCGGKPIHGSLFFEPTVLSDVSAGSPMDFEESFGPVAPFNKFQTEEDIIQKANDTPYGLAAYLFSRDIETCLRVATALNAGMIGVNSVMLSQVSNPFGGNHDSGFGREGGLSGLDEYMTDKLISIHHPRCLDPKLL